MRAQRSFHTTAPTYGPWSGAIINPGITIGTNCAIGSGSVVTKDSSPNVVAVGNPCRVLRSIGEHDKAFYFRDHEIRPEEYIK